ncbi:MAG TPA: ABC transporter permease [Bryobacteraceae bacterium]|nr:ABC transporter permease [Bryobacteraceae bacterium]
MKQWTLAWRALVRRPGFVSAVVVILALGIGANTAIFSLVDAVLLKPLPYPNPDRLVTVMEASPSKNESTSLIAPARLEDWNGRNRTFESIAAAYGENVTDTSGAEPERLAARRVSPRYFNVFGVKPAAGRAFTSDEELDGGPASVVIAYGLWARRYHEAPGVIGQRLVLDGHGFTIVGVMPKEFATPGIDVWIPAQLGAGLIRNRDARFYIGLGRMRPNVTVVQAQEDLARVQRDLAQEFPQSDKGWSAVVGDLKEARVARYRRALFFVFGAVALLLLIAVANVAGLMLTQLQRRARELAIRSSIGGTRRQVVSGVMREVVLIAAGGVGLGYLLAAWLVSFLAKAFDTLPHSAAIRLDWRALLFAALGGFLAVMLCGLLPALRSTRADISALLSHGGRGASGAQHKWQSTLVACQIAVTVLLVASAGLMLRSYHNLSHVDLGFDPAHAITFHVGAGWGEDRTRVGQMQKSILAQLESTPGVESAGDTNFLPTTGATLRYQVTLEGLAGASDSGHLTIGERSISRGYLSALGTPLLAGQDCPDLAPASNDPRKPGDPPKALVSRRFAESYGNGQNLVGRHLRWVDQPLGAPMEIVGIAGNAREDTLDVTPAPYLYVCMVPGGWPDPEYVVRTHGDTRALMQQIRPIVRSIDASRAVFGLRPVQDIVNESLETPGLNTRMLTGFAIAALLLASIGLYGLVSLAVAARTREIGVRIALGAGAAQIAGHVVSGVTRLLAIGVAAGLLLTFLADRVLRAVLFGVSPLDLATLAATVGTLAIVSALATFAPARRAARIDPLEAIRTE